MSKNIFSILIRVIRSGILGACLGSGILFSIKFWITLYNKDVTCIVWLIIAVLCLYVAKIIP